MKLEDIYYFEIAKRSKPEVFKMAETVYELSRADPQDKVEMERRLVLLSKAPEPNGAQRRASTNFLAEMVVYHDLDSKGLEPHWVSEQRHPTPDIASKGHPIEVKHLNRPRDEDIALSSGNTHGGSVNMSYEIGLQKKVEDFVLSAESKFKNYHAQANGTEDITGTLYLLYSKSIDAMITNSVEWERPMQERVEKIAKDAANEKTKLVIIDIDSHFNTDKDNS